VRYHTGKKNKYRAKYQKPRDPGDDKSIEPSKKEIIKNNKKTVKKNMKKIN